MTNEELEQVYDCLDGGFGETSGKLSAHITALESEIERLKCLALHLFIQVSYHEYKDWGRIRDTFPQSHASDLKERSVRNAERWCRINKRSYEAYRKAKAALREGK